MRNNSLTSMGIKIRVGTIKIYRHSCFIKFDHVAFPRLYTFKNQRIVPYSSNTSITCCVIKMYIRFFTAYFKTLIFGQIILNIEVLCSYCITPDIRLESSFTFSVKVNTYLGITCRLCEISFLVLINLINFIIVKKKVMKYE